ncbi:ROK family protein, partial [Streptococcus sobrinus]
GGIIADGNLIHGVAGAGGEIGHINVQPFDGFECTCGNKGCLETVASATGVVRVARLLAEEYEGDSQIKATIDNGETVTSKDVFLAAQDGDKFADSVVEKVAFYLGLATANLGNTLNPDSIVLGGGVSAAGEFLRSRVEKYFLQFAFPAVKSSTKIKIAELGNDAGIIGAASLARQFA